MNVGRGYGRRLQPPPDEPLNSAPPPGYQEDWIEASDARIVDGGKCRRPGCRRPAVWELRRSNGWWRYCDWHTYGRRIEDGRVLIRRTVPITEPGR